MRNIELLHSKTRLLLLAALVLGTLQFPSNAVAVPAAPSSITAVATTSGAHLNGSITVRWAAVTGATAYAARLTRQSSADAPISRSINGQNNTEVTFNDLIGGATYVVQVRTVQVLDLSEWSADTLTAQPKTAPKAPGAPTAVAANASARVSWTRVADADNGGFAINSYLVTETQSGRSVSVAGTLDLADVARATFSVRELVLDEVAELSFGRPLPSNTGEDIFAALSPDNRLIALLKNESGKAKPIAVFAAAN
jgi:hypothetical protein